MNRVKSNLLISSAAILLFASFGWSQATTSLRGTVTDASGAVIPGAKVTTTGRPACRSTWTTASISQRTGSLRALRR